MGKYLTAHPRITRRPCLLPRLFPLLLVVIFALISACTKPLQRQKQGSRHHTRHPHAGGKPARVHPHSRNANPSAPPQELSNTVPYRPPPSHTVALPTAFSLSLSLSLTRSLSLSLSCVSLRPLTHHSPCHAVSSLTLFVTVVLIASYTIASPVVPGPYGRLRPHCRSSTRYYDPSKSPPPSRNNPFRRRFGPTIVKMACV